MNRKEFQEWLEQFPEDTIIEIAIQEEASAYQAYGPVSFKELEFKMNDDGSDMGHGWEYSDFTKHDHLKEDSIYYGKRFLEIGEAN